MQQTYCQQAVASHTNASRTKGYIYHLRLFMCADAVPRIYDDVSDVLATCQIAAFIEPINAALKVVHTGVFAPLTQV